MGLGNKSLSLVMIVRDEESCLRRCLDSAAALADEIVIVDTGSTDRTVEIAREYDAVIFSFPWGNDFAAARNFSVEKATMDWVLWLDADEEIAPESLDLSIESGLLEQYDALAVPLVNFFGKTVDHDQVVQIAQPRLFKNHLGFRFENQIHEWLNISSAYAQNRVGFLDLVIYHYGYMDPLVENKQKSERNVNLLLQDLKEDKDHAWTHYYLAGEYYRRRKFTDAFEHVNRSIILFLQNGIIPPPSMLYSLKYSILIETGSWEGAWPGIKSAVKMFPDYVDLTFYMGVILYHKKMFKEALACFQKCIEMGEENLNYLCVKGLGSFRAWHFLGLCYEALQNIQEALSAYQKALVAAPGFAPASESMSKLLEQHPDAIW